ncbi:PPC domain-containing protein [Leptolyngbya sp. 7M]|uniref:PPC domain-containing protein n=1 Tax=Leptolyngbya sp. 7M TaxID=2812896 RepID=UPI001B8D4423|nr:PPC domain-containing protein [Leptolyngbya sp. 7M]QYO63833.1 PPC domain-containing protein [Leptolyngbya sp. 7M]
MLNRDLDDSHNRLSGAELVSAPLNLNQSVVQSTDFTSGSGVLAPDAETDADHLINHDHDQSRTQTLPFKQQRSKAKRIQLTNHAKVWQGAVGEGNAADLYRFDLTAGRSFNLKLKSFKNNTDVVLLDSSGQVADESSCDCRGKPKVIKTILDAGTYYVQVTGQRMDASYQLSLSKDPGSHPRTAQPIGLAANPQTIKNDLSATDRADWYRFDLTANDKVDLRLQGLKDNANLALLDQSGKTLQTSRQLGRKSEAINHALEAGTYYVKVFGQKCETPYRLTVSAAQR